MYSKLMRIIGQETDSWQIGRRKCYFEELSVKKQNKGLASTQSHFSIEKYSSSDQ